jgi:hypothetical protein
LADDHNRRLRSRDRRLSSGLRSTFFVQNGLPLSAGDLFIQTMVRISPRST